MSIFRESFLEEPYVFESMLESINVELLNEAFDVKSVLKKAKELWDRFVKWFKEQVKKIRKIINDILKKNKKLDDKPTTDDKEDREIKYKEVYDNECYILGDYNSITSFILKSLITNQIKEYLNRNYNFFKTYEKYGKGTGVNEVAEKIKDEIERLKDNADKWCSKNIDQINSIKISDKTCTSLTYDIMIDKQQNSINRMINVLNSGINLMEGYIPEYNNYIKEALNVDKSENKTVEIEEKMAIVKCMQFDIPNLQKLILSFQQILIKLKAAYEFNENALQSL